MQMVIGAALHALIVAVVLYLMILSGSPPEKIVVVSLRTSLFSSIALMMTHIVWGA